MPHNKPRHSIQGVEIFSVGKWNGDEYTHDDLNEMVKAFEENKTGIKPYLKLGHDDKQKLIQEDGMPAAGWVERIYIKGDKLVADFVDIPSKIYALIKSKAYRKVSSEIFWNISIGQKTYKRMLAAVALLGADTPGVMNLNDILAMYKIYSTSYEKINAYEAHDFNFKGDNMDEIEKELAAKKAELEKAEAEKKEFALKQEQAEKELAELKEYKIKAEEEKAKLQADAEKAKLEKFVADLQTEKLCTPAMKELVTELLGPDKKEYSANKLSKEETLKEILKLFKAGSEVNLEESSETGKKDYKCSDDEMDKKAKQLAKDKNISYSAALKQLMKEKKG